MQAKRDAAITDDELNQAIAVAVGWDEFVIIKRGLYYRPDAGGYTASLDEAWKLPREEAKKYEMYADNLDVPGCEKVLIKPAPRPNYTGSLECMHEAEQTLDFEEREEYCDRLGELKPSAANSSWWSCAHATARQRAQAFVRTIAARAEREARRAGE